MEKYENEKGEIAVLISPGCGAGWSTWGDNSEFLCMDKTLVEMYIKGSPIDILSLDAVSTYCESKDKYYRRYIKAWDDIDIVWVKKGQPFIIEEVDGAESIRLTSDLIMTAQEQNMRFKGKKPIFSRDDTWSLDCVLSPIIAAGLKKFKEVIQDPDTCGGCPFYFVESAEEYATTDEEIDAGMERWYAAIDQMIYAFEDNEPVIPDDAFKMEPGEEDKDGNIPVTITHPNETGYEQYKEQVEVHDARVAEGLKLFAKHYDKLWW